jgi:predicted nucleic acid-binding Zn ribbon protein
LLFVVKDVTRWATERLQQAQQLQISQQLKQQQELMKSHINPSSD